MGVSGADDRNISGRKKKNPEDTRASPKESLGCAAVGTSAVRRVSRRIVEARARSLVGRARQHSHGAFLAVSSGGVFVRAVGIGSVWFFPSLLLMHAKNVIFRTSSISERPAPFPLMRRASRCFAGEPPPTPEEERRRLSRLRVLRFALTLVLAYAVSSCIYCGFYVLLVCRAAVFAGSAGDVRDGIVLLLRAVCAHCGAQRLLGSGWGLCWHEIPNFGAVGASRIEKSTR